MTPQQNRPAGNGAADVQGNRQSQGIPPATEAAYAVAAVVVLDVERRTCPHCGPHGLCTPLLGAFRDATDTIIAGRHDRAVAA